MMLKTFCTITKRWLYSISLVGLCAFVLFSCQTFSPVNTHESPRLTERDVVFQKGLALFDNQKFGESAPFFLKVTQSALGPEDEVYNNSLWKLSTIYEKFGEHEKSVLALLELEKRNSSEIPLFRIQLALSKNYIRLENKELAFKIQHQMDQSAPTRSYSLQEIYAALEENSNFNYDHLILEELQFLGQIQKYFIFIMESPEAPLNQKTTELLIHIYDGFFNRFSSTTASYAFKKSLSIELLEQLRKFDFYKLNSININPYTISKFSNYTNEKQKFLTDWLHR